MSKKLLVAIVLGVIALYFLLVPKFEMVGTTHSAYKINKITGKVTYYHNDEESPVAKAKEK